MIIIETCPKCGGDLRPETICTYPPIPKRYCPSCGWSWQGEPEQVIRIPFTEENVSPVIDWTHHDSVTYPSGWKSPCPTCPNYPANGGSGYCNCTLGTPPITC